MTNIFKFPIPINLDFFVDVNVGAADLFYDDPKDAPGPFCVEFRTGYTTGHPTEEAACAVQRAWRRAHNRHPITGLSDGLTERQTKALDWMLTVLIEQTAERAHGLQPDQAVEEIQDLTSLVELLPWGHEARTRLLAWAEELRREHQARLDQVLAAEAQEQAVGFAAALRVVCDLAEGNVLDPRDIDDDPDIKDERDRQVKALEAIQIWLNEHDRN